MLRVQSIRGPYHPTDQLRFICKHDTQVGSLGRNFLILPLIHGTSLNGKVGFSDTRNPAVESGLVPELAPELSINPMSAEDPSSRASLNT